MNTNKQGRKPIYESGFKIALAHEYLTSNLGYGAIAAKYGLPGADTVRFFVNWYKRITQAVTATMSLYLKTKWRKL